MSNSFFIYEIVDALKFMDKNLKAPLPIISKKETEALDDLTKRYNKLIEQSMIAKCGSKAAQHIPKKITKFGNEISSNERGS